jgi:cytochrome c peroxidase
MKYFALSLFFVFLSCKDPIPTDQVNPVDKTEDLTSFSYNPQSYNVVLPAGFPKLIVPTDNPLTLDGVELGRKLFYDPILSKDSSKSCFSCHIQSKAFTDGGAVSIGLNGISGTRSSMSLENTGFYEFGIFWDGRVHTLEEQALLPVEDATELQFTWNEVVNRLKKSKLYPEAFRKAFGITKKSEISKDLAKKAIAQFERTLVSSGNSKYDRVINGKAFFDDDELRGYGIFNNLQGYKDAQCGHCHAPPLTTTGQFFNNGIDSVLTLNDFKDKGLGNVTKKIEDNGKFKVPSLRNIMLTAPYMHDGRMKTIEEVLDHYQSGGHYAKNLDPFLNQININTRDKADIIAFLKTLTDTTFINDKRFSNPF